MNTEPPEGDDLQRMLVSMKQDVLARAEERHQASRRRGRRAGIVIGVVAVLGIGLASGGVALGMIPQPFAAAPASTPSPTGPAAPSTPASAPIENTPVVTPTPTPSRPAFALDDPDTWTISPTEVGPLLVGGRTDAEVAPLPALYTKQPENECPASGTSFWDRADSPQLTVVTGAGDSVSGIAVGFTGVTSDAVAGPTTAAGAGVGTTLDELRALYPGLENIPRYGDQAGSPTDGPLSLWLVTEDTGTITFQLGDDAEHVTMVWVGSRLPPYEFCG